MACTLRHRVRLCYITVIHKFRQQALNVVVCFSVHSELRKPLLPVGRAGILISEILHILCKQMVSCSLILIPSAHDVSDL